MVGHPPQEMVTLEKALDLRSPYWRVHPDVFLTECMGIGKLQGESVTDQQRMAAEDWGKLIACRMIRTEREAGYSDDELDETLKPFLTMGPEDDPEAVYREYKDKVGMSIMSAKGPGKDTFASWMMWHWLCTMPGANGKTTKIIATAPSERQLDDVLWSEIQKWAGRRDPETGNYLFLMRNDFEITSRRIYCKGNKSTWFAVGHTAPKRNNDQQSDSMAGRHADHLMIVDDEWTGIEDSVSQALNTTITQPLNFVLGLFNPKKRTGFALKTHYDKIEKHNWVRVQWSALDSPLVTAQHIAKYRKYGERHPLYRTNVLGLPPLSDDSTLIPWDWAMSATENVGIQPDEAIPVVVAIDPAGDGDDPYMCGARQGGYIHGFKTIDGRKLAEVTSECLAYIRLMGAKYVVIDNTGGYGASLAESLSHHFPMVFPIAMSESPSNITEYTNLRAELAWKLRTAFEKSLIFIEYDEETIGEITSIKKAEREHGKLQVEDKRAIRKRIGSSPTHFDILSMTYYVDEYEKFDGLVDDDDEDEDGPVSWRAA